MLLDIIYFKEDHVVLQDVDGSQVWLTAEDAVLFLIWMRIHEGEVAAIVARQEKEKREVIYGQAKED